MNQRRVHVFEKVRRSHQIIFNHDNAFVCFENIRNPGGYGIGKANVTIPFDYAHRGKAGDLAHHSSNGLHGQPILLFLRTITVDDEIGPAS